MRRPLDPRLPVEYELRMDHRDFDRYDELARTPLEGFMADMPAPTEVTLANDQQVRYIDLPGENDSSRAVIVNLPFGNAYSPAMHIRMVAMQRFLESQPRVLVFPNNVAGEQYYDLSGLERQFPLLSLSRKIIETSVKAGVERANVVGDSQGASVGGALLSEGSDDLDLTGGHSLREPVTQRGKVALKVAFMRSGLKLNKAINDSGIPALSEAQHSRGGVDQFKQMRTFKHVAKNADLPVNKSLHRALAIDRFAKNITSVRPETIQRTIHVVRMGASLICGQELDTDLERYDFQGNLTVVKGYGHEGPDNVILGALLTREHLSISPSQQATV